MNQPQVSASTTIDALNANLTKAFVEREDAATAVKAADIAILAIRNVLAGVQVGQKHAAEQAAQVEATPTT